MDIGLELRQARERRGLSLQQLSKITKISLPVLDAIETLDEARLPAPVFTRSFVKTYAAEVRLDPHETLQRYLEQFEPAEPSDAVESLRERETDAPAAWSAGRVLQGRFGTPALLILVAVTAAVLAGRNYRQAQSDATAPAGAPAVSTAGFVPAQPAEPQPVGTSGTAAAPLDTLQLTITPTGPCWVQATVNGAAVLGSLLNAGDRRTVEAPSDVTLRVGDPATFAFSINGKPAKIPGGPGQAVTVRVTKENYSQFLVHSNP